MANKKTSEIEILSAGEVSDLARITILDVSDTSGAGSGTGGTLETIRYKDVGGKGQLIKVEDDIASMLADQANQIEQQLIEVEDASADPNLTFPQGETRLQAYYRYLGDANGSIDDYTLISAPYASIGGGDQDLDSVLEKGNISDNLIKLEHPSGTGNLSEYNKANLIFTEGASNPNITQYGFKRIESSKGSDLLRIWLYDDQNEQMTGRGTIYFPKLSTNFTERTLVTSVGGVVADVDGNVPISIIDLEKE